MKTIKYTCDNTNCLNNTESIEISKWIEIGSNNNSLYIRSYLGNNRLKFASKLFGHSFLQFRMLV